MPWLFAVAGYVCGSVPFGVIVTSLVAKKDVRAAGSGNIGATNVARVAGKKLGALVLLLDAAKGAAPVWLAQYFFPELFWVHVATAAAAFLGHVFPVWLRFKGDKGVATALGVLLVLLPVPALFGFVTWVLVLVVTRISSVGSLLGGAVAIGSAFFLEAPQPYALLGVGIFVAMLLTHRGNIARLLKRSENRV